MSVAENYENFADGGVILWGSEPPSDGDLFLVRLKLKDGSHDWSTAWKFPDGRVGYEAENIEDAKYQGAQIVGYCRGPDPNSNVAYQLGDPGEEIGG